MPALQRRLASVSARRSLEGVGVVIKRGAETAGAGVSPTPPLGSYEPGCAPQGNTHSKVRRRQANLKYVIKIGAARAALGQDRIVIVEERGQAWETAFISLRKVLDPILLAVLSS